ncbi:MAG: DMT family transporter [Planctomycetota bacterium]
MSALHARWSVLLAALFFSTGGAAIKGLSLTGAQRVGFRSAIAAVFLLAVFPPARRLPTRGTLVVGSFYALTVASFVLANTYTTAATAIFVQMLAPIGVLMLSPWLLGERVRRADLVFLGGLSVGFALLFSAPEPASATAPDPRLGLWFAALACVGWTGTVMGLRRLARGARPEADASVAAMVLGNAIACAGASPWALPVEAISLRDAGLLCWLGVFQVGVANLCLTRGLRHVSALEASMLIMLEPVLNPLWTWVVHHEEPHPLTLFGGAIVLLATLTHALATARSRA